MTLNSRIHLLSYFFPPPALTICLLDHLVSVFSFSLAPGACYIFLGACHLSISLLRNFLLCLCWNPPFPQKPLLVHVFSCFSSHCSNHLSALLYLESVTLELPALFLLDITKDTPVCQKFLLHSWAFIMWKVMPVLCDLGHFYLASLSVLLETP